jgi:AcrR family transcriptional regulator
MAADVGLRERKKQRTRQLLIQTARRLFSERGFEHVSVAEIADAAEVSPATVFNYFPSKEDLVYGGLEEFEARLLAAIRERPKGTSIVDAFSDFILEPRGFLAAADEREAAELLSVTRMIGASPALVAREQQIFASYAEKLAQLIADETNAEADDLRPAVAATALIGVHRALISYVRGQVAGGQVDRRRLARRMRTRGEQAIRLVADGLAGYGAKR